jgi:hypothetical protein
LSRFLPRFPFFLGGGGQPLSVILFCIVLLADSCPLLLSCYIFSHSQSRSPSAIMTLSHGPNDTKLRYQTTVSSNPDIQFTKAVQLQRIWCHLQLSLTHFIRSNSATDWGTLICATTKFPPTVSSWLVGWLVSAPERALQTARH